MAELNIVIDKIEEAKDDKGKRYLKVTDKAGVPRNFKEGRNNLLTNKEHLLGEGKAIKIFLRDYATPEGKKFPYIYDFETIAGIFEQEATAKVQAQAEDKSSQAKNRSVALSYAKDLAIADKIAFFDIVECAELFYSYMVGDLVIESGKVMEFYLKKGAKVEKKQSDTQIEPDKEAETAQVPPKEETKLPERSTGMTTDQLLEWVAKKKGWTQTKTARNFLVNVVKISPERIDADPEGVYDETKQMMGWD